MQDSMEFRADEGFKLAPGVKSTRWRYHGAVQTSSTARWGAVLVQVKELEGTHHAW